MTTAAPRQRAQLWWPRWATVGVGTARWLAIRHRVPKLLALIGGLLALRPSQLPHPVWLQLVVAVASATQGLVTGWCLEFLVLRMARWHRRGRVAPAPRGDSAYRARPGLAARLRRSKPEMPPAVAPALILTVVVALIGSLALAAPSATGAQALRQNPSPGALPADGLRFVHGSPTAAEIAGITGRPARGPVRSYVGLGEASTPMARAQLALKRITGAGALERKAVLIAAPTGSGWVDPAMIRAAELLSGGDIASVAVQYSDLPSWVATVRGTNTASDATADVVDVVATALQKIPPQQRPKLLVAGESLGASGIAGALHRHPGLVRHVDAGLAIGLPRIGPGLSRSAAAVVRRFAHPDDPVPQWSPELLVDGSGWRQGWLPISGFWRATADLVVARQVPSGHGHRYGPEVLQQWRPVLGRAGLTASKVVAPMVSDIRSLV